MKLYFYGAAQTVTGSCYLLDTGSHRILVDCGMFQGNKALKERNYGPFPFEPGSIDLVLLTHAHIDHTGLVPKLFKHGYNGEVVCTHGTKELCSVMLPDSGHIQEMEVERKNRKNIRSGQQLLEPIYTAEEGASCAQYFHGADYNTWLNPLEELKLCFREAGHIFGSAMLELEIETDQGSVRIVFSGDLGNDGQPIINNPHRLKQVDYLVMESTYGNRLREKQHEEEKLDQLAGIITKTFARGGNLIIPAFAVERTQDLLYYLSILINRGDISPGQIYIDSPLAIAATEIFCNHPEYFDPETRALGDGSGKCPLYLPNLSFSRTAEESMALNRIKRGALIISASGMCDAGRIKHHLKHNLWRKESTIMLVGYQAQGTLGRRILEGAKKVRIHGEEVMVRADIKNLEGFSAHADQKGLLDWLRNLEKKPQKIFVTHGEEKASDTMAQLIKENLDINAEVPQWLQVVDLETGTETKLQVKGTEKIMQKSKMQEDYLKFQEELKHWFERVNDNKEFELANNKINELYQKLKE